MSDELPPRILAIDPGKKRVGLAVSDPFGNFPVGLDTIANHEGKNLIPELLSICEKYEVKQIVMGLPISLNGEEGIAAQQARQLAEILEAGLQRPIDLMDERMTSKIAQRTLQEQGIQSSRHRKSGIIDQSAAMHLLEDYMKKQKRLCE